MEKNYNLELSFDTAPQDLRVDSLLTGETLLRLHPHWFIEGFSQEGQQVVVDLRDYASDQTFRLRYRVDADAAGLPILAFDEGPLQEVCFNLQAGILHARVTSDQNLAMLEESFGLGLWLRGIREYIRLYLSNSLNTRFFRTLMNRAMLKMNPSQRKICIMIYKITVVELVLIVVVIIGFVYFNR
jgi:hypothetical protein